MAGANAATSALESAAICASAAASRARRWATAWARAVESRVNSCWSAGARRVPRARRGCDEARSRASTVESLAIPRCVESRPDRSLSTRCAAGCPWTLRTTRCHAFARASRLAGARGVAVPGVLPREPIVRERRVVVAPAREQPRRREQWLGVGGLEPDGRAQQGETRVLLAVLPGGQAVVEQLSPEIVPVARDIVGAFGREREGAGERRVGARYIARRDREPAEIVPGGGIGALFVLDDGVGEEPFRLSELRVARLGLLDRAFQRSYRVVDLGVSRRQLAGRLRRDPPPLSRERGTRRERESQESRGGTHGRLEMARLRPSVNSRKT